MPSLAGMSAALNQPDVTLGGLNMNSSEAEMLAEAAMLREHRARLENPASAPFCAVSSAAACLFSSH